ncbi:MAG: phospholipase D family protein [Gammaproteobacteria bacterium]
MDTELGSRIAPLAAAHPGKDGILGFENPVQSFAARVALARSAERTLDVQYYIWHGDTTGMLLLQALREAAERGVRVRLLLDDNGTRGIDAELAALDSLEHMEVRLFNPFRNRRFKSLGYVYDFSRLNRRMHNKSFTADSQATMVGGRNVGDEYFGATTGVLKADLDVMLVGPIVDSVSTDFDGYWASASAYPVAGIVRSLTPDQRSAVLRTMQGITDSTAAQTYQESINAATRDFVTSSDENAFVWAKVRMVTDDPAKGMGSAKKEGLLVTQLDEILEKPTRSVLLVSPYFVPGKHGTQIFTDLAKRGVDVRILTNALEATDVIAVHSGYAKRRKPLLAAGVQLYEMQRQSADVRRNKSAGPFGSSASSLHAKTFAVDGSRAFVGSFNLDQRSIHLNTELGFVIDSPELAQEIESAFDNGIPESAYEVHLDDNGHLYWLDRHGSEVTRLDKEPNSGPFKRLAVTMLGWLPIEWLL